MTTQTHLKRRRGITGKNTRVALAVSRFNPVVTARMLQGARRCLREHGVLPRNTGVYHCPGAFELPQAAAMLAQTGEWDGIVCLGAVIRGETPHFEHVSLGTVWGIQHVAVQFGIPVAFGVLTTENLQQALERAGGTRGNKGWDAAQAALEMIQLRRSLRAPHKSRRR
jgi:6,7-dimethyl-8-ribityllumazine synthase